MKILVVRHGPAGDKLKFAKKGEPDARRPLTAKGRAKMKANARGLARLAPVLDALATSPLLRASQTADLLAGSLRAPRPVTLPELVPGTRPEALLARLKAFRTARAVALVGHEPDLGRAVSYLATGGDGLRLELKKGGACLLEFSGPPRPGGARLLWALTPRQLRALSKVVR